MKFAHLADCHIGGWRESDLRDQSIAAFSRAVTVCLEEEVDFVIIAGDLFNTSVPSVDALKQVAGELKSLKDHGKRVYIIPGSHDYSPSGKTMIDVLEKSGLCENVFKFNSETGELKVTIDEETGVILAGVIGLRGGLEKQHYKVLNQEALNSQLRDDKVKIFLFHSLISEFKPAGFEMIDSENVATLPKGFDYYAGGHPHFVFQRDMKEEGYGWMMYPGPLFPNSFKELEDLGVGGLYIVEGDVNGLVSKHVKIRLKDVASFVFSAEGKNVSEIEQEMKSCLSDDLHDKIVTVRVEGVLKEGKPQDLDLVGVLEPIDSYVLLKNTAAFTSKEFEEISVEQGNVDDIEKKLIESNAGQIVLPELFGGEQELASLLMSILHVEKGEGEKVSDFESRVVSDVVSSLKLHSLWGGNIAD